MNILNRVIHILDKVGVLCRWTNVAGLFFLFLMILVTFVDVIMRYFFSRPNKGVMEITEVMMICAIFLAIGHTYNSKANINIDLITSALAPKARTALEFITNFLGLGLLVIIIWQVLMQALYFLESGTYHSQHLPIPATPFAMVIVFGCLCLWLLILRDLLGIAVEALRLGLSKIHWLIMFGVPILFSILAVFWVQSDLWDFSKPLIGVIGLIFSLILFLSGMPIAFALIMTSLLFISHMRGLNIGLDLIGTEMYRNAGSYRWSPLPFFVSMGYVCLLSRFGEDIYHAAYKWLGHIRGGLSIATIGACTGFAAIVGDTISTTATMGLVALPQMEKYNYDPRLSTGCIAAGAILGPIIPPSVMFIMFGILTNTPIGDLFIASIIPGLIIALAYIATIFIWCRINPRLAPSSEKTEWKERIKSSKAAGPVVVLFSLVIGGIYAGVFTPTEGGSIGVVGAMILGILMRRITIKIFIQVMLDSGKTVSMVFIVLIGAVMFSRFAAWCNLSGVITDIITKLDLSISGFMALVMFTFIFLGFFADAMPLILVGVPILQPVATSMGIEPLWAAVLMVISLTMGTMTPPVGINLFTLKGVAPDYPIGIMYRGVMPFILAAIVSLIVIFLFPSTATWLPNLFK